MGPLAASTLSSLTQAGAADLFNSVSHETCANRNTLARHSFIGSGFWGGEHGAGTWSYTTKGSSSEGAISEAVQVGVTGCFIGTCTGGVGAAERFGVGAPEPPECVGDGVDSRQTSLSGSKSTKRPKGSAAR